MMSWYAPVTISTTTGEMVHLKFIESFRELKSEEDTVIDKLRDDVSIVIRTVSGAEYLISLNSIRQSAGYDDESFKTVFHCVHRKWSEIQAGKY